MMRLSAEILVSFIGGQVEIRNGSENYILRGEIENAWFSGNTITVRFAWLLKKHGGPSNQSPKWTASANLEICVVFETVFEIDNGRIATDNWATGETCTFFPKGYKYADDDKNNRDRARVISLA